MFSYLRTDYNQYLKRLRAMLKNYVISASILKFLHRVLNSFTNIKLLCHYDI